MFNSRSLLLLGITSALLTSGCASSRMLTDMKPSQNAELKSPAGTFYIADLKYLPIDSDRNPQVEETYRDYQRQLLPLLRKECVERYPALFANDAASAIPLGVSAETTTTQHPFKTMAWMYGTLLISGVILPCPGQTDEDITLKAGIWRGREGAQASMLEKKIRREIHMWVSLLTPAALITIPGESDVPKGSDTLFNVAKIERDYLQLLASQLATTLAETIAAKDPEFWTMQPRQIMPTIYSPTRPNDAPAVIPSPMDPVNPF